MEVNGLTYIDNFISSEKEDEIVRYLDTKIWSTKLKRRTQHYGYEYNYSNKSAKTLAPPLEGPIKEVADVLNGVGIITPEQCIVNEYTRNQGIGAHTDSNTFGPIIVSISLLTPTNMIFTRSGYEDICLTLMPRSLLLLSGDARNLWKHQIDETIKLKLMINTGRVEYVKSEDYRRISLTYRTMK